MEYIIPWIGMEECVYHNISTGGWNLLGAFSSRSTAMGETLLSNQGAASGYLNPAFLSSVSKVNFSLDYRYTENIYKTSIYSPYYVAVYDATIEKYSFKRKSDHINHTGFVVPVSK